MDHPDSGIAMNRNLVAVLCHQWLDSLDDLVDQRRQSKGVQIKLHAPRFDLRQIENVVDQSEEMPSRAEHAVERLKVLIERFGILAEHLTYADDGVKRRTQLVAHVGEELRLVLARLGELAALRLDFVEQPHVLDRDYRLVGEGRQQLNLTVR